MYHVIPHNVYCGTISSIGDADGIASVGVFLSNDVIPQNFNANISKTFRTNVKRIEHVEHWRTPFMIRSISLRKQVIRESIYNLASFITR